MLLTGDLLYAIAVRWLVAMAPRKCEDAHQWDANQLELR